MNCARCQQKSAPGDLICKYCGFDLREPSGQATWTKPASGIVQKLVRPPHLPDLRKLASIKNDLVKSEAGKDGSKPNRCKNCGQELNPNSRFCENCGKPLVPVSAGSSIPSPTERQINKNISNNPILGSKSRKNSACLPSVLVGIGVFVMTNLLGICGYSVFFNTGTDSSSTQDQNHIENIQPDAVNTASDGLVVKTSSQPPSAGSYTETRGCNGTAESAIVDLECRKINIAVSNEYLPFNYISIDSGETGGWDYETGGEICELLHCEPVFHEVAWDDLIASVADGQYEMGADGVTISEDRKKSVDFSDGYITMEQRLLVRKDESRFQSIKEVVNDTSSVVGTQTATTTYAAAVAYLPEDRIKTFETVPLAVQALIKREIDAVIIEQVAGLDYIGENSGDVKLIGDSIDSWELGFFFPKGSDLVNPINQALEAMKNDGTLEMINRKYFGPDFKITIEDIQR